MLQNATEVSRLQVRASGGSTSERRYAVRIVPLFPGTGGRWLHIVTALQIAALLSGSRGGQRGESFCERRYAVHIVPLFSDTGGQWAAYGNSAADCSAVKRFSGRAA